MILPVYRPDDWYWFIGDDQTRVFATARGVFVSVDDAEFVQWIETHDRMPQASNEALAHELAVWRVAPVDPDILILYQSEVVASDPIYPVIIDMQDQIDMLAGVTADPVQQFFKALRGRR